MTPKSFSLAPNAQYGNRLVVDLFDNAADAAPPPAPTPDVDDRVPAVPVSPSQPQVKLPPPPPAPAGKRDIIVVIDAGHGGEDPGASGSRGQHEKDVVLAIARELQRQINGMKGYRAELTPYRLATSFRCAAVPKSPVRRCRPVCVNSRRCCAVVRCVRCLVFALSDRGATSETARWLADSENRSDLIGGAGNVSLDDKDKMLAGVLLDLSMTRFADFQLECRPEGLEQHRSRDFAAQAACGAPALWC